MYALILNCTLQIQNLSSTICSRKTDNVHLKIVDISHVVFRRYCNTITIAVHEKHEKVM